MLMRLCIKRAILSCIYSQQLSFSKAGGNDDALDFITEEQNQEELRP